MSNGVRQGGILSIFLFRFYIRERITKLKILDLIVIFAAIVILIDCNMSCVMLMTWCF